MNARLAADWPAPASVQAFTTLRHGAGTSRPPFDDFNLGNRHAIDGDDPLVVERNRRELEARFGLPSRPHWLRQVHGTRVACFDSVASQDAVEPEADAAVTREAGVVLAILTADCLPVVFAARDGREVAAAHAGWRGLAAGVLEQTLAAMQAAPDEVLAWLGPAAGPGAYEVGADVRAAFVDGDAGADAAFVPTRPEHWRVDLYALARRRLREAGVGAIHGGGECTISDPQRYYSHRRDGRSGRMATLVWFDQPR